MSNQPPYRPPSPTCGIVSKAERAKKYVDAVTSAFTAFSETNDDNREDTIRAWNEKYQELAIRDFSERDERKRQHNARLAASSSPGQGDIVLRSSIEGEGLMSTSGNWSIYQPEGESQGSKWQVETYLDTLKTVKGELEFLSLCHTQRCEKDRFCKDFFKNFHTKSEGEETREEFKSRITKRQELSKKVPFSERTYTVELPKNTEEARDQTEDLKMTVNERLGEIDRRLQSEYPEVWRQAVNASEVSFYDVIVGDGFIRPYIMYSIR